MASNPKYIQIQIQIQIGCLFFNFCLGNAYKKLHLIAADGFSNLHPVFRHIPLHIQSASAQYKLPSILKSMCFMMCFAIFNTEFNKYSFFSVFLDNKMQIYLICPLMQGFIKETPYQH
jgi:hypothetical protein